MTCSLAKTVAELEIVAGADTSEAESKLDNLDGKVNKSGENAKVASMAFIGAGAAIAGGLGAAIGISAKFESQISSIGAVSGLTGAELDKVRAKALQLGSQTSFSATEAASAMDTLLKAGMPISTVLNDGAKAALDLAAAAGTDVTTAAELMTSAMNVFGDEAGSATDVANSFNAAANVSAASIESLSLGFSAAALPAQMMGLSLEDLNVALALFSQNGLNGSDAGTSFKTMLMSMANPTSEQATLMDQLGISFFDAQGNFIGLEASADVLQTALSGMTEEQRNATLATLFGSDAIRAASILYGAGAEGVAGLRTEMHNQASAADQAAARMDNLGGALETLKGTLETAAIMIGSQLSPYIMDLATHLQGAIQWFTNLDPAMQGNIAKGAALAAGLLVLAGALGMVGVVIGPIVAGFGLLLSPIGLVVAAIAGLYIAYQTNFLGFRDGVNAGINLLKSAWPTLQSAIQTAGSAIGTVWSTLQTNWSSVSSVLQTGLSVLQSAFSIGWSLISTTISTAASGISTTIEGIRQVFSGLETFVSGVTSAIKAVIEGDFDGAKEAAIEAVSGLKETAIGIFNTLLGLVTTLTAATRTVAVAAFNGLKDDAVNAFNNLKSGAINALNSLLGTATALVVGIKTAITGQFDAAKSTVSTTMTNLASDVVNTLTGLASSVWNAAWSVGWNVGQGLIDGITGIWDSVVNYAKSLADAVGGVLGKALEVFSPSRLTTYYGEMLGAGLIKGMELSAPKTFDASESLAMAAVQPIQRAPTSIAAPSPSSGGGRGTVINQTFNVTVDLDGLQELAEAAEFVQSLPRERQLVFGGSFSG